VDIRKSEPWEEKDTEKILWALKALREGGREGGSERGERGAMAEVHDCSRPR